MIGSSNNLAVSHDSQLQSGMVLFFAVVRSSAKNGFDGLAILATNDAAPFFLHRIADESDVEFTCTLVDDLVTWGYPARSTTSPSRPCSRPTPRTRPSTSPAPAPP